MKTLNEAILSFRLRCPDATSFEINAFIQGWTAHEVAVEVEKLLNN